MIRQTPAEEVAQEAKEVRRNAGLWSDREIVFASQEKPADEPGDEAGR